MKVPGTVISDDSMTFRIGMRPEREENEGSQWRATKPRQEAQIKIQSNREETGVAVRVCLSIWVY